MTACLACIRTVLPSGTLLSEPALLQVTVVSNLYVQRLLKVLNIIIKTLSSHLKGVGRNYRIAKCTAANCALRAIKKQGGAAGGGAGHRSSSHLGAIEH